MRLKIFLACLFSMAILASSANAAIILDLVLDPATDADSGIPAVGPHVVTSTQTGALRYHLYAYDNTPGSFGISSYNIFVNGATTALHRAPLTTWADADENSGPAGFPLLRSPNNQVPIGTFQGSQPLPGSGVLIANIGREVSNFTAKIPAATSFAAETSGQWGNYATDSPLATGWVLIGEGAYAQGAPPTIGSAAVVTYFNEQFASLVGEVCIGATNCLGGPVNTPPIITDFEDPTLLHASIPGSYSVQLAATDPEVPPQVLDWDGVSLISYTPDFGGTLGVGTMPTISDGGLFDWNTVGSGRGHYVFGVSVSDGAGGSDTGTVTLHIGAVPEPATIALFGIAMVGGLGLVRRRNG